MRLLIVEDSALIRKVTHLAFPSREHELQQPFDAILLDLRMPGMNGVEFIHALRQRAELVQDARRLGVAAVVKKPWKPQELAMLVQQACGSRRLSGEERT